MIVVMNGLVQGTDEWHKARLGILTASQMKNIITPSTLKPSSNDRSRALMHELLAQRLTRYVEPHFVSDDMLRGQDEEADARAIYAEEYAEVEEVGFVTNDGLEVGGVIGYSPDGLVGNDGAIEIKCPRAKGQIECILGNEMPGEHAIQVQTGLLVSGRKWCDFISYSAGLPMFTVRVHASEMIQAKIVEAARSFYAELAKMQAEYERRLSSTDFRLVATRRLSDEITSSNGGML